MLEMMETRGQQSSGASDPGPQGSSQQGKAASDATGLPGAKKTHGGGRWVRGDDGIGPDEVAGDGTWTLKVDVPFQAPPGEFELEFTAFRSDGQPILVRDEDGDTIPLSGTFSMVIRYPETP